MPGPLESILSRVRTQSVGPGGLLSSLGSGGGILSTAVGPLQSRLATLQAAGTLQAKVTALVGTLGMRLKTLSAPGGLLSKITPAASPPATDTGYQVAGASRTYASPTPPAGLAYR